MYDYINDRHRVREHSVYCVYTSADGDINKTFQEYLNANILNICLARWMKNSSGFGYYWSRKYWIFPIAIFRLFLSFITSKRKHYILLERRENISLFFIHGNIYLKRLLDLWSGFGFTQMVFFFVIFSRYFSAPCGLWGKNWGRWEKKRPARYIWYFLLEVDEGGYHLKKGHKFSSYNRFKIHQTISRFKWFTIFTSTCRS